MAPLPSDRRLPVNNEVLDQPVTQLPVSPEFLEMMQTLHFQTLRDLLQYPAHQLLQMDGFGYRMLKELIALLDSNDLTSSLRE
jgi:DNA-directed RNA polymerase alpha subunit